MVASTETTLSDTGRTGLDRRLPAVSQHP